MFSTHLGDQIGVRILRFIHCWSLDAPLVALAWQAFWDECLGVFPRWAPRIVLALTVWLIYAADRWLDARWITPEMPRAARHATAITHHRKLGALLLLALTLIAFICLEYVRWQVLRLGFVLSAFVGLYMLMRHVPVLRKKLPAKELCVGLLFAAGTCLPAFGWLPDWTPELLWASVLFGLLCALNCFAISCWEIDSDRAQGDRSLVLQFSNLRGRTIELAALLGIAALFSLCVAGPLLHPIYAVIGVAALSIAVLDASAAYLSIHMRRMLVDWALLLPAPLLLLHCVVPV